MVERFLRIRETSYHCTIDVPCFDRLWSHILMEVSHRKQNWSYTYELNLIYLNPLY